MYFTYQLTDVTLLQGICMMMFIPYHFSVNELHCDSEDNVQCVPASCGVSDLASDNDHNPHPGTSQVIINCLAIA